MRQRTRLMGCIISRSIVILIGLGVTAIARGDLPKGALYPTEVADGVGWTEDGVNYVYIREIQEGEGIRMRTAALVVVNARTGKETLFAFGVGKGGREAFKDWLHWRELVNARLFARRFTTAETSANGAYVVVGAKHGLWPPFNGGVSYGGERLDDPFAEWNAIGGGGKAIPCAIKQGERTIPSHTFVAPKDTAVAQVVFLWSPDGRRIAWIFRGQEKVKEGEKLETIEGKPLYKSFYEVVIDRTVGPRIQLAGKGVAPEVFEKVAEAIEKEGFAPTSQDAERPQGDKTVVLARQGHAENAKKIAGAVPGGAVIKPLSGKGQFDIVVVLGKTVGQ